MPLPCPVSSSPIFHQHTASPNDFQRPRVEETQRFAPAKFDASSVGLFLLLAQKAGQNGDGLGTGGLGSGTFR